MRFIKLISAVMFAGALHATAGAESVATREQMNPYIQVKTVVGDEYKVRAFFSPTCTYSKQYLPFFNNLSRTLPAGDTFEFTPVVNKGDGMGYAMAFLAVKRFYPAYVPNFVEASMRGTQELGLSPKNWAAIEKIGRAAQIPASVPRLVSDNSAVLKKDMEQLIQLQHDLKITNTPSVSVAGTYIVTPEFTMGDSAQFSSLVNGLISMTSTH